MKPVITIGVQEEHLGRRAFTILGGCPVARDITVLLW